MKRILSSPWLPPAAALAYLAPRVLVALDTSALILGAVVGVLAGLATALVLGVAGRLERRG